MKRPEIRVRVTKEFSSKPDEISALPVYLNMGNKVPRYDACMTAQSSEMSETIECPLCLGEGTLERTEVLDRLGVKDFARVAQLSAEEAFRLLTQKHNHDQQNV